MRPPALLSRFSVLPLLLLVFLLLLAACGADSSVTTPPAATNTPLPPAATATATTGGTVSGTAVGVSNFKFSPGPLTVKAGTTVVWTNKTTDTPHTVTSDSGAFDHQLNPGATFSFTFTQPGVFHYHCSIHPSMTATVTVTP